MLKKILESQKFQNSIISIIVLNSIILGIETLHLPIHIYNTLVVIDHIILGIFIIEILLKLLVYRFSFFKNFWNWFDFIIVAISLVPSAGALSVLRTLRILRVLRLISTVESLRKVIEALIRSVPGIGSVTIIMSLIFYIFAVIGTNLYKESFPQWFGHLGKTMYSLFQIMTLESWSMGIVRPVMEKFPIAWLFFIPYILITTFIILNLFIAIVVSSMQEEQIKDSKEDEKQKEILLEKRLEAMEKRILEQIKKIKKE